MRLSASELTAGTSLDFRSSPRGPRSRAGVLRSAALRAARRRRKSEQGLGRGATAIAPGRGFRRVGGSVRDTPRVGEASRRELEGVMSSAKVQPVTEEDQESTTHIQAGGRAVPLPPLQNRPAVVAWGDGGGGEAKVPEGESPSDRTPAAAAPPTAPPAADASTPPATRSVTFEGAGSQCQQADKPPEAADADRTDPRAAWMGRMQRRVAGQWPCKDPAACATGGRTVCVP